MPTLDFCLQELPYRAVVPWPFVQYNGQWDWISSVDIMESWLAEHVGNHYSDWTWTMWTLHQPGLCSVSFAREQDSTLFLLRWS
jgi:hypothetical protein